MPRPFFLVLWNGRNSESLTNAGLIPQPLSTTDSTTRSPRCSVHTRIRPPDTSASLAFSTRLVTTLLNLLAIGEDRRQRLEVAEQFDVLAHVVDAGERGGHNLVQVGVDADGIGPIANRAQAGNHVIDSLRGVADAAQSVLAERRVIKVHGQVLQHQVERRRRILQIVNEECRHGAERLQFPGMRHFVGQPDIQQHRRDLIGDAFQQLELLDRSTSRR